MTTSIPRESGGILTMSNDFCDERRMICEVVSCIMYGEEAETSASGSGSGVPNNQ